MSGQLVHTAANRTALSIDEPHWITSGYVTYLLIATGAPSAQWETEFDAYGLGHWGNMNPPIGKFIIGIAVAHAKRPDDAVRYLWDFSRTREQNLATSSLPPIHILREVRIVIAVLASLCLLLIFLLARYLTHHPFVALAAPVFLWSSPVFRELASVVFVDIPQLAFVLGAAVTFAFHAKTSSRVALWASLVLAGLACATKLSAAVVVVGMLVYLLVQFARRRGTLFDIAATGAVPLFVFVAVNPFLYPDAIERIRYILASWEAFYAFIQTGPDRAMATITLWQRVSHMAAQGVFFLDDRAALTSAAPRLLATFAGATLAWRLALLQTRGRRVLAVALSGAVALGVCGVISGGVALLLGAACADVDLLGANKRNEAAGQLLFVALFTSVTVVVTTQWLPVNWMRYYLLTTTVTALWLARGVDRVLGVVSPCSLPR
jgi:hypothetical protein